MVTSTYIQIQYQNLGYEILQTKIHGVVCAYDPAKEAPFSLIVLCDNRSNHILSKVNTDQIRRILSEDIAVPEIKDILFVILNRWRSSDLVHTNHIVIESGTGKCHTGHITSDMKGEYRVLATILAVQKRAEEKNRMQKPYFFRIHPVWGTYLMIAAVLFWYPVSHGMAETYGISYQTLTNGEYTRLITYLFTHGGLMHLLGNLMTLLVAGRIVERKNGTAAFFLVYILSGISAALVTVSFKGNPDELTVGASGAIYGLLGAVFTAEAFTDRYQRSFPLPVIGTVILSSLLAGARYLNTDNLCHIGGLFSGMLIMGLICLCRILYWDLGSIRRQRFFNKRIVLSGVGGRKFSMDRTGDAL